MSGAANPVAGPPPRSNVNIGVARLDGALRSAGPPLLFGLRLWASVSIALYAAFWLQLDNPFWAGASAAIVCQPQLGASLRKGWFRMLGTLVGAIMGVVLAACFAQDRLLFLGALALWAAACAFVATLLRNFASYAASLAGYTTAIIAGDLLGAVGGVDANAAFLLAVTRATEICLGIVCAGVVLAATDLGGARRHLASSFAELVAGIAAGLARTLAMPASDFPGAPAARRQLLRRLIGLAPIIDQALGESSEIHYHSPVLRRAVDGLFSALVAWDVAASHLATLPHVEAQQEASLLLESVPPVFRSPPEEALMPGSVAAPSILHRMCQTTAARWTSVPQITPSLQLLTDKIAEAFAGIEHAVDGIALLIGDPAQLVPDGGHNSLRVPDWLPPLVSAARTFAAISAAGLFWIATGWPHGSLAIAFTAIVALLLAPRSDETYGAAILFTVGAVLDLILTAIVAFAVLPALRSDDFTGFCLVIGACLVPIGALLRQARQPWLAGLFMAMTMGFVPILQPTNPESYDTLTFYNIALAIVAGMGAAALFFRLLPPLSPAYRTRRLLALTLRDLRRLARGGPPSDWGGRVNGRLTALPDRAMPLQHGQLLAALTAGSGIIYLRQVIRQLSLGANLDPALAALAEGDSMSAIAHLSLLDTVISAQAGDLIERQDVSRVRASILVVSEALTRHAAYFDAGAQR